MNMAKAGTKGMSVGNLIRAECAAGAGEISCCSELPGPGTARLPRLLGYVHHFRDTHWRGSSPAKDLYLSGQVKGKAF